MCDPATAMLIGGGAGGAQLFSTLSGAKGQKEQTEQQTIFNVEQIERQYDKLKGQQKTSYAVSGVQTSGSVEEVLVQTEEDREFDKMTEIYKGEVKLAEIKRQKIQGILDAVTTGFSVYGGLAEGGAPKGLLK